MVILLPLVAHSSNTKKIDLTRKQSSFQVTENKIMRGYKIVEIVGQIIQAVVKNM
jgi:hypothetical protein